MQARCVISFFPNLLNKSPRISNVKWRQFQISSAECQRKKDGKKKKKKGKDEIKIIRPEECTDLPKPILEPRCKSALIIGGSQGFGFSAADHLLCKGARKVVIADDNYSEGQKAVEKLCNSHGRRRAEFVHYDVKSDCHLQAGLKRALCKLNVIDILFNNLDKDRYPSSCPTSQKEENCTVKTIKTGIKLLGKKDGGSGGIIINCASIYGFMGWPQDPFPIYCKKEPAIEVTKAFAEEYKVNETGVRLVALCPSVKHFSEIGLPDFPEPIPNRRQNQLPACLPHSQCHIGPALCYVMAWAESGSVWLVEPAVSVHRVPRLIHFPEKEGEKVDPKLYEAQGCSVNMEPPCVKSTSKCVVTTKDMCIKKESPKKKGRSPK